MMWCSGGKGLVPAIISYHLLPVFRKLPKMCIALAKNIHGG